MTAVFCAMWPTHETYLHVITGDKRKQDPGVRQARRENDRAIVEEQIQQRVWVEWEDWHVLVDWRTDGRRTTHHRCWRETTGCQQDSTCWRRQLDQRTITDSRSSRQRQLELRRTLSTATTDRWWPMSCWVFVILLTSDFNLCGNLFYLVSNVSTVIAFTALYICRCNVMFEQFVLNVALHHSQSVYAGFEVRRYGTLWYIGIFLLRNAIPVCRRANRNYNACKCAIIGKRNFQRG